MPLTGLAVDDGPQSTDGLLLQTGTGVRPSKRS